MTEWRNATHDECEIRYAELKAELRQVRSTRNIALAIVADLDALTRRALPNINPRDSLVDRVRQIVEAAK